MEKGRGPLSAGKRLTEKGVPSDIIKIVLEAHFWSGAEREAALLHVEKLLRQAENPGTSAPGEKELARIARRLASQGFHSHVIYEIIGRLRG